MCSRVYVCVYRCCVCLYLCVSVCAYVHVCVRVYVNVPSITNVQVPFAHHDHLSLKSFSVSDIIKLYSLRPLESRMRDRATAHPVSLSVQSHNPHKYLSLCDAHLTSGFILVLSEDCSETPGSHCSELFCPLSLSLHSHLISVHVLYRQFGSTLCLNYSLFQLKL